MGNNCLAMIALAFYNSKANFWEEIFDGINAKCVFISHQRNDKAVAKAIADYILTAGN